MSHSPTGTLVFKHSDKQKTKKRKPAVDPAHRKRIAVACENCKRRKQKCDGRSPCSICSHRHVECVYPPSDRVNYTPPLTNDTPADGKTSSQSESPLTEANHSNALPDTSASTQTTKAAESTLQAVDFNYNGLLTDHSGKIRYVGESSIHSILQRARVLFRNRIAQSAFTEDPLQFTLMDGPPHHPSPIPLQLPPKLVCDLFLLMYKKKIAKVISILDLNVFIAEINLLYESPMTASKSTLTKAHLVFAIGSHVCNVHFKKLHRPCPKIVELRSKYGPQVFESSLYFESAMGMMPEAAEDGSIAWVEAYMLASVYYELLCKRNAVWFSLGCAIRLAQALGLSRKAINDSLELSQALHNRRIWRELFIRETVLSLSLGRPISISLDDWDDMDADIVDPNDSASVQLAKLCTITADICHHVYRLKGISSSDAQKMYKRLSTWSEQLPADMKIETVIQCSKSMNGLNNSNIHMLLTLHLTYLNSIMLLTRPFLYYMIVNRITKTQKYGPDAREAFKKVGQICVRSAMISAGLAEKVFSANREPIYANIIVYYMFSCGICIVLSMVHNENVDPSYTASFELCRKILGFYKSYDLYSERYYKVLTMLYEAVQDADKTGKVSKEESEPSQTLLTPLIDELRDNPTSELSVHFMADIALESQNNISAAQIPSTSSSTSSTNNFIDNDSWKNVSPNSILQDFGQINDFDFLFPTNDLTNSDETWWFSALGPVSTDPSL
ncbi:hypothetical protein CANCADRAFT_78816 [Tortispora caseinolytica NRRL Y-17796]|uniref:Zn(2)-C6 fungal-type domain-containing protein n=1 Tax=Tortispora caseinolytica NRRL Y-17796 TaxID=767744 RepID=A0A1E4TJI6_9ASCO|nr:hypothetical protein CANCADRAFT_78816 [Tortispora caseinolytica NRRL Y-17796]